MGKILRSYLDRESHVHDRATGKREKIEKKFRSRTTPQGSILSPTLWRIYDAIFTKIYKDHVEKIVDAYDWVDSFHHVSYADDHITVMVIAVDKNLCNTKVSALIDALAGACRTLLDEPPPP